MSIEALLGPHQVIGWDVDGTILDHPNARLMHDYIRATPEKTHIVVTFRSHGLQHDIWDDMADVHDDGGLTPDLFDHVLNVSDAEFRNYRVAQQQSPLGDRDPAIISYLEYKGRVCHEHGITVLVDDMTDHVIKGCDRYGVVHVHPDWF